ncbi:MAG: hypothetical protein KTR20_07225 [Cellvibrionaceae bacterium]|nr:hypothetical protein [Cellvibrionaceae bacterium]
MVVDSHDVALEPGDSGAGVYAQDPAGSGNYHWIAVHHGNLANPVSDKVVKDFDQSSLITPEVITWIEASACLRLNDDGFFVAAPPGCEPQHFARAKHGDTNCDARFVPLTRAQKLVRLVNFGLPSVVAVAISALACLAYRRHQASQGAQVAPAEGSQIELQPLQASAEEA